LLLSFFFRVSSFISFSSVDFSTDFFLQLQNKPVASSIFFSLISSHPSLAFFMLFFSFLLSILLSSFPGQQQEAA
jgi:hypothetical protein